MLPDAYIKITELQETHWWFVGARYVYRTLLDEGFKNINKPARLLDIGCGSGGNLELLCEYGPVVAMDISFEALHEIHKRPNIELVQASTNALPFATNSFDVANMLGVIEHLDDDLGALKEAVRVCRSDGILTLLTSAFQILWSHHDEANLHRRRYRREHLVGLFRNAGLNPRILSYQNFFVFIPTLAVRLFQRISPSPAQIDVGDPPPTLNNFLKLLVRFEAWLIRWTRLPFGVDLVALCDVKK